MANYSICTQTFDIGDERCHLQAVPFPAYTTKERAIEAWNRRVK